ncbi:MAG: hypothetical protein JO257_07745 [Deltaproteobacteria bacterium]|nr:hypothetical protein [Deltaproteobacteria bacterium]
MPIPELDNIIHKLRKRGFKQDDGLLHECPSCKQQGVVIFAIAGKQGGRDIRLCIECGKAKSWRAVAGMESREEDTAFDLDAFLR